MKFQGKLQWNNTPQKNNTGTSTAYNTVAKLEAVSKTPRECYQAQETSKIEVNPFTSDIRPCLEWFVPSENGKGELSND